MGRPRSSEPRTQQLNLSFSISEFADIRQRAYALGMRPAHFCRAHLLRQNSQPEQQKANDNISRLILDQLRRLGNNLNQIARHLHQTGVAEDGQRRFELVPKDGPQAVDLYRTLGGETNQFRAIYKVEKEQMFLCIDMTGTRRPTAFESTAENGWVLMTFKKSAKKD